MCAVRAAVSGCARANLSTGERFPALAGRAGEFVRPTGRAGSTIVRIIDVSMK